MLSSALTYHSVGYLHSAPASKQALAGAHHELAAARHAQRDLRRRFRFLPRIASLRWTT
jgi:hypothetical protein